MAATNGAEHKGQEPTPSNPIRIDADGVAALAEVVDHWFAGLTPKSKVKIFAKMHKEVD